MEGDAVQPLQAEVELVKEQLGLLQEKGKMCERTKKECKKGHKRDVGDLVQGTDEGVPLIKPQQDVQRPLQL